MQRVSVVLLLAVMVAVQDRGQTAKTVCKTKSPLKAENSDGDPSARDMEDSNISNKDYLYYQGAVMPQAEGKTKSF
jgi:hypothetical protein